MDGVFSLTLVLSPMGTPLVSEAESARDSEIIRAAAMVVNNQANQGRTVAWRRYDWSLYTGLTPRARACESMTDCGS